jgi:hypothetical protein
MVPAFALYRQRRNQMTHLTSSIRTVHQQGALLLLTVVLLTPVAGFADEPYVARGIRQVFQVEADGTKRLTSSANVIEARNREGSRYSVQELPAGKMIFLWKKSTGLQYQVDPSSNRAVVLDKSHDPMAGPRSAPENQDASLRDAHLDMPCVRQPIRSGSSRELIKIGENCVSLDLGIILKSEATLTVGDKTLLMTSSISEVWRGVDPDPAWFEVPAEYTIIERRGRLQ